MPWRCHISNFRSLGHQEPGQEHPYPPSLGWILRGQEVLDTQSEGRVCPGGVKLVFGLDKICLTIFRKNSGKIRKVAPSKAFDSHFHHSVGKDHLQQLYKCDQVASDTNQLLSHDLVLPWLAPAACCPRPVSSCITPTPFSNNILPHHTCL